MGNFDTFLRNSHVEEESRDGWEDQDPYAIDDPDYDDFRDEPDQFRDDVDADHDALISAGFGDDEDYGYFGDGDEY